MEATVVGWWQRTLGRLMLAGGNVHLALWLLVAEALWGGNGCWLVAAARLAV